MKNKITYDSLMRDDEFLRDAYKALQAQGINVSKQRGHILDRILTNKIYFDSFFVTFFLNIGLDKSLAIGFFITFTFFCNTLRKQCCFRFGSNILNFFKYHFRMPERLRQYSYLNSLIKHCV